MQVRTAIDTHLMLHIDDLGPVATTALRKHFTRQNPKFKQAKRQGYYTGPTKSNSKGIPQFFRSYEMKEPWLLLPRGTLESVRKLLAAEGLEIGKIFDRTLLLDPVKFKMKEKLRPYQKRAINELVDSGSGILKGPCGSGKTVAILGAIAKIGQPTIVVVASKFLMRQWIAMASRFLGVVPGTIGGGKSTVIRSLTVALQQTVCKRADAPWWKEFGCLAGDEIQHWAANTFQTTAASTAGKWRIGCSADETRKDGLEYMIYETFGPLAAVIDKDEVQKEGKLLPVRIEIVPCNFYDQDYQDAVDEKVTVDWNSMLDNLLSDPDRNKIIMKHIKRVMARQENRIMILSERKESCYNWAEHLRQAGYNTGLMVGGNKNKDELYDSIDDLRTGKIRIGVGTAVKGFIGEGLDIPPLTHTFVICPTHRDLRKMEQMGGRTARPHGEKEFGTLVYFWDQRMWPREREIDDSESRGKRVRLFLNKLKSVCDVLVVLD